MSDDDAARLEGLCRSVLEASWAEGERPDGRRYAYTRPSPARYRWQWYWDSCFASIVWRRLDPSRPRRELETLLEAMTPEGRIGHVVFWERPISRRRRLYYNVRSRADFMTGTIQPPLLAWAWRIAVGDTGAEPRIGAHHEWLRRNRDLDGDGLLWLVQPDESGLDSSPKFDPVWGRRAHARARFPAMVRANARLDWDARAIRDRGGPVLCEVLTNVLWGLSRLAAGEPSITPALVDRLYDRGRGMFIDEAQPGAIRPAVDTWTTMAPLALPDLPEEIGRRLVEEHLFDRRRYWLAVPPPSVAATEPSYEPGRGSQIKRRYWRGPTWVNAAWMLWLGMKRLGYDTEAAEMTSRLAATVLREGLREYYDPRDGTGLGATDFAWTSLIWEMAAPDGDAPDRSYL